jgi:hypothetical protein
MCAHSQATLKSEVENTSTLFSLFYLFSSFNVNSMRDLPKREKHKDTLGMPVWWETGNWMH